LKVKGASRQQILDLVSLRNRPNLALTKLAGGPEVIHTFQVSRPPNRGVIEAAPYVKVYPLSAAVATDRRCQGPEADAKPLSQKEALDHVLSLIKAAVGAQESPDGPPLLQVHAENPGAHRQGNDISASSARRRARRAGQADGARTGFGSRHLDDGPTNRTSAMKSTSRTRSNG